MTRQEHKNILAFLNDVLKGTHAPLDLEADAIIRAYLKRNPDAAYRLTMLAMELSHTAQMPAQSKPTRRGWLPMLLRGWQL
ncbi:MAG: hypothetical protein KGJ73_02820 [Rhodospirillales bacterium]|nr:hypothetical protein [Rhodospirillales bacterium]